MGPKKNKNKKNKQTAAKKESDVAAVVADTDPVISAAPTPSQEELKIDEPPKTPPSNREVDLTVPNAPAFSPAAAPPPSSPAPKLSPAVKESAKKESPAIKPLPVSSSPPQTTAAAPVSSPPQTKASAPVSSPAQTTGAAPVSSPPQTTAAAPVSSPPQTKASAPVSSPPQTTAAAPVSSPPQTTAAASVSSPPQTKASAPVSSPPQTTAAAPVSSPPQTKASISAKKSPPQNSATPDDTFVVIENSSPAGLLDQPVTVESGWEDDEAVSSCRCGKQFGLFVRKHHCRSCGKIYCSDCTLKKMAVPQKNIKEPSRVCDLCVSELARLALPFSSNRPNIADYLSAPDGTKLYHQAWLPTGGHTKASICFIHSFCEHAGRYSHIATRLANYGFAFHAIDLRGHGRSSPGSWTNIDTVCGDIGVLLDAADDTAPKFILAHGVGAALAIRARMSEASQAKPIRGMILSAPAVSKTGFSIFNLFTRMLAGFAPHASLTMSLKPLASGLSRTPGVEVSFLNDALITGTVTPQEMCDIRDTTSYVFDNASKFNESMFVLHGGNDTIVDAAGSQEFVRISASPDKEIRVLPDCRHDIFSEPEYEDTVKEIASWINARL